jgi:hypothetical protein
MKKNKIYIFVNFLTLKVDEEDEKALEAFMTGQPRRLLGDIIAEKQAENQASCNYFIIKFKIKLNLILF